MKEERDYTFRWPEVSGAFAVLSPMQIAFLHEKQLHRHTALDDELFDACGRADEAGIRSALDRGANIHALNEWGESACACLVVAFSKETGALSDNVACDSALVERLLRLLLDHGADLDLVGVDGGTAIDCSLYCASWMMELLLRLGANPDEPSWISPSERAQTPLERVWDGISDCLREWRNPDDCDMPDYWKMKRLLLRYGGGDGIIDGDAIPFALERIDREGTPYNSDAAAGLPEIQCLLFQAIRELDMWGADAALRSGAEIEGTDSTGLNAIQIAMEESRIAHSGWIAEKPKEYQRSLTDYVLFLLGYMHFPMETEDWRDLESLCRAMGFRRKFGLDELLKELAESPLFGERFRAAVEGIVPGKEGGA